MAILEKIRNRTVFLIVIIGLALFAFVISDVISSRGGGMNHPTEIGKVNGKEISTESFRFQVENLLRSVGGNATTMQAVNRVWDENVRNIVLNQQFEKLGLSVEKDQILSVLSKNQAIAQNPEFQNEFGVFDASKFVNYIAMLKSSNPALYEQWRMQEEGIVEMAKQQTYFNLIRSGLGVTQAEAEMAYHQENDKADIKYVTLQYSSIADSTINVSDKDIKAYIKKHEKEFEREAYRNIQYVVVNEMASEQDKQAIKDELVALLQPSIVYNSQTKSNDTISGFAKTNRVADFVAKNSQLPYDSLFVGKSQLPVAFADTLFALPKGAIYGPYEDAGYYKISRMIDKQANGSVEASHILIAYQGSQAANPNTSLTKEQAKAKAEELLAKAKVKDADFATLARENSDDPSASIRGGDLGFFQRGMMVKPFEDFAFSNPIGYMGVVETDFGFHVIKITNKAEAVKLATIAQKIEASDATANELFTKVTRFEMDANEDVKNFGAVASKSELSVLRADNLNANDEYIIGLGNNRQIVQWAFTKDTKVGEIKRFQTPTGYVVAQLTKKAEKGISTTEEAAPFVKPILIRQKKAELLAEKMKGASLEEIASANKTQVQSANALTMNNPIIIGVGREPKVVGAAFGLKSGQVSKPIEGENGVYVVEVSSTQPATALSEYKAFAQSIENLRTGRASQEVYNALLKASDIEDNRSSIY
ncbi:peptidylprolyl isomerase [Capnocytophaga canimorsus]|uniref:peptidylprolyl isomerase n=1 Tax=Capnocytophaga canimorsus TaxID=28188 RepID=UPI0005898AE1|nr:peptidylprolyl isomerase [Capnocytophaga canimorsus]CEN51168.1 putative Peptidylprolyl isomerase [Capnocytophaga canimorsus]VEJ19742.1 Putative peptidyl-prolyl cis-trans isomerase Cbf2 precursor [Capnocytophaga canimorsus]